MNTLSQHDSAGYYLPVEIDGFDIHHKNFDKHDNRIENLQLLSASEHQKIHKAIYKPSEMHKKAISKGLKGRKLDVIHRINLRRSKKRK
jgi:hypothetical protein